MDLGPKLAMSTGDISVLQAAAQFPASTTEYRRQRLSDGEIDSFYDISSSAEWILLGGFRTVTLQFPDNMLHDSVRISDLLEQRIGVKPFILADTSYGSCCVDEVAAQHIHGDCILHYGDACMSTSEGRIPVRYIFPKSEIDKQDFENQLSMFDFGDLENVVLIIDVCAGHASKAITNVVTKLWKSCHVMDLSECPAEIDLIGGIDKNPSVLFVGEMKNNSRLTLLMMSNPGRTFFSYDVARKALRKESAGVNRMLKKRLYFIEKAKDAQIVGIVVGALSVGGYLQVIDRVKGLCRKAGKKFIILSIGKINVAKLSNFADAVDVFVWISCPFNIMLETGDYPHPVLTPFELEVACDQTRHWYADSRWITDFRSLLQVSSHTSIGAPIDECSSEQEMDVSLITGRLRRTGREDQPVMNNALISRSDALQLQTVSVESRFAERSWRGLEEKLGETAVTKVKEGRRGIASSYEDEVGSVKGQDQK